MSHIAVVVCLSLAAAAPISVTAEAERELTHVLSDPKEHEVVVEHLRRVVLRVHKVDAELGTALAKSIAQNLKEKRELPPHEGGTFRMSGAAVKRTVIDYEAFKQDAFIRSGVFPKRYFGYFDLAWDTAERERTMKRVVHRATELINAYQAERKAPTRVTDMEIAVTFISEGGAILLREKQDALDDIHPVMGIGLDDVAIGFTRYPVLLERLDTELSTNLRSIVGHLPDGRAVLNRHMTFEEALLGTAVMWLYEKELCAQKLRNAGRAPLETRSVDEQFIFGSLVYNSGILFADDRVELIRTFGTADYLAGVSKQNAQRRWPLPVEPVQDGKARIRRGDGYPHQPTSWSAVYHVLQRYGGYAGLKRFTDVFDENGMYRDVPAVGAKAK